MSNSYGIEVKVGVQDSLGQVEGQAEDVKVPPVIGAVDAARIVVVARRSERTDGPEPKVHEA